jgi:sodium/potassium-transporting ATPase subunit alpha
MSNPTPKKNVDIDEHLMPIDEVCKRYGTGVNAAKPDQSPGLSESKAKEVLVQNGPNVLSPPKKVHPILIFLHCLAALFNLLLILAGILTYVLYAIDPKENAANVYLGGILIGVSFLNALIEFVQLQKSASVLESFLNMIPQQCRLVREGSLKQGAAADLVVGDIVFVRMGDKVPADLLIFNCSDLKVDNSSLTGESEPQERIPSNDMQSPLEATNIAFNGTLAVAGEGYGIVIRTGDETVLGQIAGMTQGEKKNPSPLSVEIDAFVKIIATIAAVTAIFFFCLSLGVGRSINSTLNFAIGVFVAWVPEGLPATVTMLLTLAAKKMAGQNVLVKDLKGVETLGAITLLATDKTGTLTRNQMTVTKIWSNLTMYSALRNLQNANNPISVDSPGLKEIMMNSALNSRAKFDRTDVPVEQREIIGDATESGLTRFSATNLDGFDNKPDQHQKVFEIPFNSDNKWAMSVNMVSHESGDLTLYLKGAPERVLRLCSTILLNNQAVELTEEHKAKFMETYEYMAGQGHRVLAFAQLSLPGDQYPKDYVFNKKEKNYPTKDLTFVGLVSLEDPPKHGVREAIGRCRTAGIRVMMVTGDHPLTAEAIGRKINLMISDTKEKIAKKTNRPIESVPESEVKAIVIHGEQIDSLAEKDWENIFSKEEIIFARTSPKHKLQIVKRAQSIGHIVGVTGDGVNDSPALKKADLGIAMNESGSDVSKEAAAMILLDDNFASTVRGIEEGRLIFTNLKKSIKYTVTHSIPEVLPQLLYIIVPIPLPLTSILILVIDLGFELFAALSYAWDKPETETGLMKLPPRKPVTPATIERLVRLKSREIKLEVDPETGEEIPATWSQKLSHNFSRLFTSVYWKEKFEKTEGEVMVDAGLLSWGYLEAGVIEAIVAHIAYFWVLSSFGITPTDAWNAQKDQATYNYWGNEAGILRTVAGLELDASTQIEALAQAQSIYYLSIMITQGFNLFACKSRLRYPFGKHMFSNPKNFIGLAIGFILGFCIVYIPPFNIAFGTSYRLSPLYWLCPIAGGVVLVLYSCLRLYISQKRNPVKWNEDIHGLQMHPTVRTIDQRNQANKEKE